jgi:hydrogenase maturation protease
MTGGVHPEAYGRAHEGNPWLTQTQCLIEAVGDDTVDVHVRFLHLVTCDVAVQREGELRPVPELTVEGTRHLPRQEAKEREVAETGLCLSDLLTAPATMEIHVPAGQRAEWLDGAGVLLRGWEALSGRVEVFAERLREQVFRLTVRVANTSPWQGDSGPEAMKHTMISAHTVVTSPDGRFVSLMEPPEELRGLAGGCHNVGTWPVLVGEEGERHTMLSAPINLHDHPEIAPESPGDLFDATEIDRFLTLSVLALGDGERAEIRAGDPRAREILDRCDALTREELMRLHGTMRET